MCGRIARWYQFSERKFAKTAGNIRKKELRARLRPSKEFQSLSIEYYFDRVLGTLETARVGAGGAKPDDGSSNGFLFDVSKGALLPMASLRSHYGFENLSEL